MLWILWEMGPKLVHQDRKPTPGHQETYHHASRIYAMRVMDHTVSGQDKKGCEQVM
jgi:hypothetical protein